MQKGTHKELLAQKGIYQEFIKIREQAEGWIKEELMKIHASGEDYLEAVLILQKKQGMVRFVDVARYVEVSKPSVCHAVATLRDGGS